jgi:hypothetical protein
LREPPGKRLQGIAYTLARARVCARQTGRAVELFVRRTDAERMLAEAIADEPAWKNVLTIEEVELGGDHDGGSMRI